MNTPLIIQSSSTSVVIYLETLTGDPATGLVYGNVTAGIKKSGASVFTSFTLTGANFTELTNGFYSISLTSSNTDTLGSLYMSFVGAAIKPALLAAYVTTAASASPLPSPGFTLPVTSLFGYLQTASGTAREGSSVTARILNQPTIVHPADQGVLLDTQFIYTTTDSTGYFSINLVTGATVEISIPDAGYKRTLIVPDASTNLFDMP